MVRPNRAIDFISDQLLESAKRVRESLPQMLHDPRLSEKERAEVKDALEPLAVELERKSQWWRTGGRPE